MPNSYYLLVLFGGTEIETHGPFSSVEERTNEAKKFWRSMNPGNGDNVFWMNQKDTYGDIGVYAGPFLNGELDD